MGFFSDLGKAFMGKPLRPTDARPQDQATSTNAPQASNGLLDDRGLKIYPDIEFKDVDSGREGTDRLIVRGWITNNSKQPIRINTTYVLKQKLTHNRYLNPGQTYEFRLYDGKIPDNENERNARVEYQLQANNDLFQENFRIKYDLQSDGKRTIGDLIDDGPVRDI